MERKGPLASRSVDRKEGPRNPSRMKTDDPDALVTLANLLPMDAQLIRSSLEAAGLPVVLQGEHASSIDTRLAFSEGVRVLVRQGDLVQAQAFLQGVEAQGVEGRGALEGFCAVHERKARASCSRCGNWLCEACKALGDQPICEDCLNAERRSGDGPDTKRLLVRGVALVLLAPLVLSVLVFIALLAWRLLNP